MKKNETFLSAEVEKKMDKMKRRIAREYKVRYSEKACYDPPCGAIPPGDNSPSGGV